MAFEKAKVLKAAEKFLSQGKITSAIKEYRQLVDNDKDDLTSLNMLGDLYVRAGKKDEAISCFRRIAEHYCEQEFTLKAIAMFKKIERLKPRDPEIANRLGALYATQGLVVDARAEYLVVADAYTRAGKSKEALDILHKIADLDPQNTEIRLKLAEGYLSEEMRAEAAAAFLDAASHFYHADQFEKSLESYARALELGARRQAALKGILAAHVALGTADEAAEILERAVEERPEDTELVAMLAKAYIEAEDAKGAERATSRLLEQNAANYTPLIDVARLYLKLGEVSDSVRILSGIIEQMLAGREERELLEIVNEVLARNPEHVEALRLLVRIHWWQRDMETLRTVLERLAESAQAAGMIDDERYALTQLIRLAPDEQGYSERLNEIGGASEEVSEMFTVEPAAPEVSQFETFSIVDTEVPSHLPAESSQFEWNAATETHPDSSFAELNEAVDQAAISVDKGLGAPAIPHGAGGSAAEEIDHQNFGVVVPRADESRYAPMMRQELESVDFYITQGYIDIAADTLEMLKRQFGSHPEIESRLEKLRSTSDIGGSMGTIQSGRVEEVPAPLIEHAPAVGSTPDAGVIDSGLAEIFEEFRVAAEEEGSGANEDYETHYNMGTAYKEMELFDEAIHEFQTAAALVRPDDGASRFLQCCNMLGDCFVRKGLPRAAVMWFKKGLDSPGHTEAEYQALSYELGLAYEQLGEIDRAIDQFTEVYGADVSYREVGEKLRELAAKKKSGQGKKKKT